MSTPKKASRPTWTQVQEAEKAREDAVNALHRQESICAGLQTSLKDSQSLVESLRKDLENHRAEAALERAELLKECRTRIDRADEAATVADQKLTKAEQIIVYAHDALDALPHPPPRVRAMDTLNPQHVSALHLNLVGRITALASLQR